MLTVITLQTSLYLACTAGDRRLVEFLLNHPDIDPNKVIFLDGLKGHCLTIFCRFLSEKYKILRLIMYVLLTSSRFPIINCFRWLAVCHTKLLISINYTRHPKDTALRSLQKWSGRISRAIA